MRVYNQQLSDNQIRQLVTRFDAYHRMSQSTTKIMEIERGEIALDGIQTTLFVFGLEIVPIILPADQENAPRINTPLHRWMVRDIPNWQSADAFSSLYD